MLATACRGKCCFLDVGCLKKKKRSVENASSFFNVHTHKELHSVLRVCRASIQASTTDQFNQWHHQIKRKRMPQTERVCTMNEATSPIIKNHDTRCDSSTTRTFIPS